MTPLEAVKILAAADPDRVHESLVFMAGIDPDRATRAKAALRLLACPDDEVGFWSAILTGHREAERRRD